MSGRRGGMDAALAELGAAFAADPSDPGHLDRLASHHEHAGRDAAAAACRRCAVALDPTPGRRAALALALYNCGRLSEARTEAEAAPDEIDARLVLGLAAAADGRAAEAAQRLGALAAALPRRADLHAHHANALWTIGDLAGAEAALRRALAADPAFDHAAGSLGLLLLSLGQWAEGWDLYRRRVIPGRSGSPAKRLPPRLDGKTVFVEGEQGLGDELFFLRFVERLAARGARVTYRAGAKIAAMVGRLPFVHQVAGPGDAAKGDHVAWLGDLPWLLDETGPLPAVALAPLSERVVELSDRLAAFGPPPYVGVTWRAGVQKVRHLSKALSPAGLAEFLAPADARVVVVQRNPLDGEVAEFAAALGRPVLDLSGLNDDLEGMLALLALLESQVAVSNTNIHLAASLGKPARLLLPFPPEFRWMAAGEQSPWFPAMRLYRQEAGGNWRPALEALRRDLGGQGEDHSARLAEAAKARAAGRGGDAEAICREVLAAAPDDTGALSLLAVVLLDANRAAEAVAPLARLAELAPTASNLRFHGSALLAAGAAGEAARVLEQAAALAPADLAVGETLATALMEAGRYGDAVTAARALPNSPAARFAEGTSLHLMGRSEEAAALLRQLAAVQPNNPKVFNSLGQALYGIGDYPAAEQAWRQCLELDPGNDAARGGLGLMLLALGRFAEGWDLTRWRKTATYRPGIPSRRLPERLDGYDVLVVGEQGLGDELFLMRFVERLAARGARLSYVTNPKLLPLVHRLPFLAQVAGPEADFSADLAVWPGDLPWLLDEPGPLPSVRLTPLPERVEEMRAILAAFGPPPYVGLTWRAGTPGFNRLSKDVPLAELAAALAGRDFRPVVLQRVPAEGEVVELERRLGRPALDLSALNDDLDGMLALLSLLDDTVAVSNTNIHLLAALGRPARLLLPGPPEYRWMAAGATSPWFPGFRLYRHERAGGWAPALRNLAADPA